MTDTQIPPSGSQPRRLRVIVAGDEPARRRAVRDALAGERGLLVVADARDAVEAVELARYYRPDVVLLDQRGSGVGAWATVAEIVATAGAAVVVISQGCPDGDLAVLRAGAAAVIDDAERPGALARALEVVAAGGAAVSPALAMALVQQLRMIRDRSGLRPIRSPLTRREWEVLDLLCAGGSTREIARTLHLTEETVYGHVKRMLRKLGVRSRAEAVIAARDLRAGIAH